MSFSVGRRQPKKPQQEVEINVVSCDTHAASPSDIINYSEKRDELLAGDYSKKENSYVGMTGAINSSEAFPIKKEILDQLTKSSGMDGMKYPVGDYPFEFNGLPHEVSDSLRSRDLSKSEGSVDHSTKGVKHDDDKCSYHLLPPFALEGTAWVFKCGAEKYSAWNHSNGMAWSKMLRAAQSHIDEIRKGRPNDPEFGTHHVFHAICSLMMLAEAIMMYPENNDLYPDAYIQRQNRINEFMEDQKKAALSFIKQKREEKNR